MTVQPTPVDRSAEVHKVLVINRYNLYKIQHLGGPVVLSCLYPTWKVEASKQAPASMLRLALMPT